MKDIAVFLIAGRGSRLKPYMDNRPKCLVEVSGTSIFHRMLLKLKKLGIKKAVLVVGYMWKEIYAAVGDNWEGIEMEYVVNEDWETSNNIVSLYRAKDRIDSDFLLLEGDIIVSDHCFDSFTFSGNEIALSVFNKYMDGTRVSLKEDNVDRFYLKNDPGAVGGDLYKTVNIYSLEQAGFHSSIVPELERIIQLGETGVYYEQAFANLTNSGCLDFRAVLLNEERWAEVDDEEDLHRAEKKFPPL